MTKSLASSADDIVESGAPKGTFGGTITLHTYSDSTYVGHIVKVILFLLLLLAIIAFVIVGFFYPECNSTQDRGFYSCKCKEGSALNEYNGMCYCLDTGGVMATNGCSDYVQNNARYVFADARPDPDSEYGGWSTSNSACA